MRLPDNIISGGLSFKKDQLQSFVNSIKHTATIKEIHLLKIKHLFFASYAGKISFLGALRTIGINTCPDSLGELKSKNMSENDINLINSLYDSTRFHIENKDPLPRISYEMAMASKNLMNGVKKMGIDNTLHLHS